MYPEMVAKVVIVIRLEALTHPVNGSPVNVIANLASLGMSHEYDEKKIGEKYF